MITSIDKKIKIKSGRCEIITYVVTVDNDQEFYRYLVWIYDNIGPANKVQKGYRSGGARWTFDADAMTVCFLWIDDLFEFLNITQDYEVVSIRTVTRWHEIRSWAINNIYLVSGYGSTLKIAMPKKHALFAKLKWSNHVLT